MFRTMRTITSVAVTTGMLAVAVAPASASNPTGKDNPYASVYHGSHGSSCVYTYQAPPAQGSSPTTPATGGNPGYEDNGSHGPGC